MEGLVWKERLLPFEQAVNELVVKFKGVQAEFTMKNQHAPIEQVEGRVKKVGSIIEKANRKNIPLESIELFMEDIAGIRIICRFVEDIAKVVEIIRGRFDMEIRKEIDYIANTKASGYRSYHVVIVYKMMTLSGEKDVTCEIQIRTLAMNFWATIEHSLNYKYNGQIPEDVQHRLRASAEASFQLDREMSKIRGEIMEAQKIIQVKNDLVDKIVRNLQSLYHVAKMEKVNELNRQFFDIYQDCNIEKLIEFNKQLETIADIYQVKYV